MGRSVVITTPILSADEMAKRLGVGKRRLAMIKRIVQKVQVGQSTARDSAGAVDPNREKAAS